MKQPVFHVVKSKSDVALRASRFSFDFKRDKSTEFSPKNENTRLIQPMFKMLRTLVLLGYNLDPGCTLRVLPLEILEHILDAERLRRLYRLYKANPDKDWDWESLSRNPTITWEIVKTNPDKDWDWWGLSWNPNITWEIIQANPDKPWDLWGLFGNHNITWEIVQASLPKNLNITWEIVKTNPDKDWDWWGLSSNPNITWENILEWERYVNLQSE